MTDNVPGDSPVSRRTLLQGLVLAAPFTRDAVSRLLLREPRASLSGGPRGGELRLVPRPTRIYATLDASHERTESWILWIMVESDRARELTADALTLRMRAKGTVVKTTVVRDAGLDAVVLRAGLTPTLPDGSAPPPSTTWHMRLRIRCTEPIAAGVDSMDVELDLDEAGTRLRASGSFPVEHYEQKTPLIFTFKGPALVTQGGITNGGHANRSGQFALDVIGLTETYGAQLPGIPGGRSESYAGWGRTLVAPAAGTIVRARSNRPDQPDPETSDPKYYAPEYPRNGDPGNHLVIDHGNGEFSMMAHFQAGSMLVAVGDRVAQGQPVGKLGSSGDTVTPHSHYQLQSGPDWENSDGLPCRFSNVSTSPLVRGALFDAK